MRKYDSLAAQLKEASSAIRLAAGESPTNHETSAAIGAAQAAADLEACDNEAEAASKVEPVAQ